METPNQYHSTLLMDGMRCSYAGKRCPNLRTSKKGGGLHRLCEVHRLRANKNQWRVDNKRRAIRAQRRQLLKKANAETRLFSLPEPIDFRGDHAEVTIDDLEVLSEALFDTNIDIAASSGIYLLRHSE